MDRIPEELLASRIYRKLAISVNAFIHKTEHSLREGTAKVASLSTVGDYGSG
jgi:hypothetical protein